MRSEGRRKVLFVWTGVTSYMADCWRALATSADVELKVVIDRANTAKGLAFDEADVLHGLDCAVVDGDKDAALAWLGAWRPDAMFVVGWRSPVSRAFATARQFEGVAKVIAFDMPWQWRLRKFAARLVLKPYLRHFAACYVPGVRARRYARWLGFGPCSVYTGLFGVKAPEEGAGAAEREPFFLYVGRLSSEKNIRKLALAYRRYRARCTGAPWPLVCCGKGDESRRLVGQEGVELRGFLQPEAVRDLQRRAGALVLTSAFDPWPLVILEAVSAGLPVICTPACGDHLELVGENGIVTDDTASAMEEMAREHVRYCTAAREAVARAKPYWSVAWAARTRGLVEDVLAREGEDR